MFRLVRWFLTVFIIVHCFSFSTYGQATDSNGQLQSDQYCNVQGQLDESCIQNAINALPATGGTVMLPQGTITASNTITVRKPNVKLHGHGADMSPEAGTGPNPATRINWVGGHAPVFEFVANQQTTNNLHRWRLDNVFIDCLNAATFGVDVKSANFGVFADSTVFNCVSSSIHTSPIESPGMIEEYLDPQFNRFENLSLREFETLAGNCYRADGSPTADSSMNIWLNVRCQHLNGDGFQLNNSDNNYYEHVSFELGAHGSGISVHLTCTGFPSCADAATPNQSAREETFIDLMGNAGTMVVQDGKADGNLIVGLKRGNGMLPPKVLSGTLYWQDTGLGGTGSHTTTAQVSQPAVVNRAGSKIVYPRSPQR